jgi:hypothetical protein
MDLHIQPKSRRGIECLRELKSHLGRDTGAPVEQPGESDTRDSKVFGQTGDAHIAHVLAKNFPRVGGIMHTHFFASFPCSMIITIIDQDYIVTVETECQLPAPVYLDRPVTCKLALERMKPPPRWFDITRPRSGIQRGKLKTQSSGMSGLDAGFRAGMEEFLQAGVSKALDHNVKCIATLYGAQEELRGTAGQAA